MNELLRRTKKQTIIALTIANFLFAGFVMYWYFFLNRYQTLFYQEQAQMFQFSWTYFLQYLNQPAGITRYFASFLTQFFYYPLIGACIYSLVFFLLYRVYKLVLNEFGLFKKSFLIQALPGLLFLPASANLQIDIANELALVVALAGFIVLTKTIESKFYYLWIPLIISILYILTAGNILPVFALFLLYLLLSKSKKRLLHLFTIILSAVIPMLFWRFVYIIPLDKVYYILTPFNLQPMIYYDFGTVAWLSVFLIPLIAAPFRTLKPGFKFILYSNICLSVITLGIIIKNYNRNSENIIRTVYYADNEQWAEILDISKKSAPGMFSCFYTNLALQRTGRLPDEMFKYNQIGPEALMIGLDDNFTCYMMSGLFYQTGLINDAQHCSYESMSGYSSNKEINIQNIIRLLACAIIKKDSCLVSKYQGLSDKTLFYKNYWQNHEPELMAKPVIQAGNTFYENSQAFLTSVLKYNPYNKAIFEYLMACLLLELDYENVKKCFDSYYSNFEYPVIPVHYAEFLVLYKHVNNLDDDFYEKYPVPVNIRERFEMMDLLVSAKMDEQIKKILEERFKDTYWFYVRFPLVASKQKTQNNEKGIY
jgi:hypothetical protein